MDFLYQGPEGILRTIIVGVLAYAALIIFLRISGKRTLSKLNAFDLVVTVALGSTLSSILVQKSIALSEGATALALLIILQFVVTFLSVRSSAFSSFIRSEPTALVRGSALLPTVMKRERITKEEVEAAIRQVSEDGLLKVERIVLESDGSISVIPKAV